VLLERDYVAPRFGKTRLALDWIKDTENHFKEDSPIVILIPGVHGDSSNNYIRRNQLVLRQVGMRSVVKAWRGFGCELEDEYGETWGPESVGDMAATVDHIKAKFPKAKALFCVGFPLFVCLVFDSVLGERERVTSLRHCSL